MDYSKTLNLPQTDFPMRANLPAREPEILQFWAKTDLYHKKLQSHLQREKFILHDGPPYANGNIHIGTALNKVLKDIIVKYKSMRGYDAPYVPGWDTHGMPIEHAAIKILGLNRHELNPLDLRRKCREYALKCLDEQREDFKRLGVCGDWENPYITLRHAYEAEQIKVFGAMAQKGYIYKGLKSVYWCPTCETALAEAEIEYAETKSPSIYVKFPLIDDKGTLPLGIAKEGVYVVIWTTTPWTMPANVAIALHPDIEYSWVDFGQEIYLMATELIDSVARDNDLPEGHVLTSLPGRKLEGVLCGHPFLDRQVPLILGEHVTLEQGTGCVHTAPGHGQEDFEVGMRYKLPVINPVDGTGHFTAEGGKFQGMFIDEANGPIIAELAAHNTLLGKKNIRHQYAHCWRCKQPVIFRATEQWFASVEGFRREALAAIDDVQWIPAWGRERIHNMVADRQDWCISRQRVWGVPIPIFYCQSCGKHIINDATICAVSDLFAKEGSDAWWKYTAEEILPPGFVCPHCGHDKFRKETDIMDVWFDSGSSHAAVLERHPALRWPADMYLEGSDQHRGWFQSSLLTAVATRGTAPYRAVLTHGFVVDGEGRKMSKSIGNVIYPQEVIKNYGADVLRLWVASADYQADIRISNDILKQLAEVYRKIRNTCRFILGNLYDFAPQRDQVPYEKLGELDRWVLLRLGQLIEQVSGAYERYEFHVVFHAIHNFCTVDLSAFYLDVIKDRLYTSHSDDGARRAAQTVMYQVIDAIVRLLAPILSFTAEEIWQHMPDSTAVAESVQLAAWPLAQPQWQDAALDEKWRRILAIRNEVTKSLETARQAKTIGNSLEGAVDIYATGDVLTLLRDVAADLPTIFIVSQVHLHDKLDQAPADAYQAEDLPLALVVTPARGAKCERCWMYSETVGQDPAQPTICKRCAEVLR